MTGKGFNETRSSRCVEWELDSRVNQLVLKRTFEKVLQSVGTSRRDPGVFYPLESSLREMLGHLTGRQEFDLEFSSLTDEEEVELGKILAEQQGFFEGQLRHLFLNRDVASDAQPEEGGENAGE